MLMVEEFVRPALLKMMGFPNLHRPERTGILAAPWRKHGADGKLHLLRVRTRPRGQDLLAELTGPQGSGLLSSMMAADALALIPPDTLAIPAGGEVLLHLIDQPEDH
jgi:molybdopterin molybdotransferase